MRIVLFDIDCLRPDHLGCYGYARPTSPNIDAVAREGMRFDSYYCASSPCLPSRTEWTSGRFGIRNGVISNVGAGAQFRIRTRSYGGPEPENDLLMRTLRAAGWDTISFSNFADRHNSPWFMSGWTEFHTPNLKGGQETADEVDAPLLRWIRQNRGRDNYLLHINYWDAHRCYRMDASWSERFRDYPVPQQWPDEAAIAAHQSLKGPFTAHAQFANDESPLPLMPGAINSRADFEHMITGYDAAVAYVDHHAGVVLNELADQGGLEDTAVIVTGDHGDAFGEHGIYSDHVCADECIHHIPLIIRWPGAPSGGACDSLLYNVDLPPALCELMGAEAPEEWDGQSFAPRLMGRPGMERTHLVWQHALYTVQRAVRTRDHLFIRTYDPLSFAREETELFDMRTDPYQTANIARDNGAIVNDCKALLDGWVEEQLSKPGSGPDPLDAVLAERRH